MQRIKTLLAVLMLFAGTATAETITVAGGYSEIVFDKAAGVPVRWTVCQSTCDQPGIQRAVLFSEDDGYLLLKGLRSQADFDARVEENAEYVSVVFSHDDEQVSYRISRSQPVIDLELPAGAGVEMATGSKFVPDPLPGFGAIYTHVRGVLVSEEGQASFEYDEDTASVSAELSAAPGTWSGLRSRYWALLIEPLSQTRAAVVSFREEDRPVYQLFADAGNEALQLRLYAGPIDWRTMREVSPVLSEMLFAALWDFLRWLTFGMMLLLEGLYALVGNYGVAIILLSLSAKILMSPLTMLADRWQQDVNRIQSLLKPELDEIKRNYKGEEAHERTLAVYKKHDVSMFYTFKSAAGFLIQIPVFIAAFDMLAENIALNEVVFLWVTDLARPDAVAELPFVIPFFGGWLNLLPFLMTALSTLAAWLQQEDALSDELQRQQSMRLYLMSAAFFVLFYTFPAGMVLYWTSSNLFHLIKVESGRLFRS
ncbi:MAG: membrane protein insertase YidC [Gammaproteobacteria bacterium]